MGIQRFNPIVYLYRIWQGASLRLSLGIAAFCLTLVFWLASADSNPSVHTSAIGAHVETAAETHIVGMSVGAQPFERATARSRPPSQPLHSSQQEATIGDELSAFELVHLHHADLTNATLLGTNLTGAHLFTAPLSPTAPVKLATDRGVQNAQDVVH